MQEDLRSPLPGRPLPSRSRLSHDPVYRQLSREAIALSAELAAEIPPTAKAKLDQLTGKIYSAQAIESEAFFTFGFSLGAKLQQEITEQLHLLE